MRGVVFNQWSMSLTHPLTTTAFELPGCRTTKSFGVVRYDATEIAPGITEVLCYGTAVFVEKVG
jgi:hypothetical protein